MITGTGDFSGGAVSDDKSMHHYTGVEMKGIGPSQLKKSKKGCLIDVEVVYNDSKNYDTEKGAKVSRRKKLVVD